MWPPLLWLCLVFHLAFSVEADKNGAGGDPVTTGCSMAAYPWFIAVVPQVFTDRSSDFATSPPTISSSVQLLFLPDCSLEL